jgi:hypothetical protein
MVPDPLRPDLFVPAPVPVVRLFARLRCHEEDIRQLSAAPSTESATCGLKQEV